MKAWRRGWSRKGKTERGNEGMKRMKEESNGWMKEWKERKKERVMNERGNKGMNK